MPANHEKVELSKDHGLALWLLVLKNKHVMVAVVRARTVENRERIFAETLVTGQAMKRVTNCVGRHFL